MDTVLTPTHFLTRPVAERVAYHFGLLETAMRAWLQRRPMGEQLAVWDEVILPLRRKIERFQVLLALSMAGMLPAPRRYLGRVVKPRATDARARKAAVPPRVFGWLSYLMERSAAGLGTYASFGLLREPEVAVLVGASAEARRILRSLSWAGAQKVPEALRETRARPPRKPGARRAARPAPEPPPPPPPSAPPEPVSRYWNTGRPFGYLHVDTSRTDTPGWPPPFRTE